MMHAAPAAPSAPAIGGRDQAGPVEVRQPALRARGGHRHEHADQEVGDADAEQRLQRIAELPSGPDGAARRRRPTTTPRRRRTDPFHGVASCRAGGERCQRSRVDIVENGHSHD